MTGIGHGPIGANGIGGSAGGIGIGGIGVGPIGGSTGHVPTPSSIGDSYQIQVATQISDSYRISLRAILEEQYDILTSFISHPSTIGDSWRISVSSPAGATLATPPTPYLYAQGFQISGLYAERRAITVKVRRQSHAMHTQGYEIIDDVNAQDTIYVDPSRCREDFQDIYFWDSVRQRAIPFWIQTSEWIAWNACYGATIILYEEAGPGTAGYYQCELRSGYDALPSQALTVAETGVTAGPAPLTQNAVNGFGDPCATPWTLAPPVGLQYPPFGSYSIARSSTITGQYAIYAIPRTPSLISDSYRIHLAKIMEG